MVAVNLEAISVEIFVFLLSTTYFTVFRVFQGAFHYAKDSGNFGRNSNGKVRIGFF